VVLPNCSLSSNLPAVKYFSFYSLSNICPGPLHHDVIINGMSSDSEIPEIVYM
jgi:hypothetical protein